MRDWSGKPVFRRTTRPQGRQSHPSPHTPAMTSSTPGKNLNQQTGRPDQTGNTLPGQHPPTYTPPNLRSRRRPIPAQIDPATEGHDAAPRCRSCDLPSNPNPTQAFAFTWIPLDPTPPCDSPRTQSLGPAKPACIQQQKASPKKTSQRSAQTAHRKQGRLPNTRTIQTQLENQPP
jgi:hypothetical protein